VVVIKPASEQASNREYIKQHPSSRNTCSKIDNIKVLAALYSHFLFHFHSSTAAATTTPRAAAALITKSFIKMEEKIFLSTLTLARSSSS
jgi:hypothetical protein